MDIEASYNFRRLSERLTTSGVVQQKGLAALASQGYEVVVNLLPDTNEYAVPNERAIVESQGIEYVYIPIDFKSPTRTDFVLFSESMDRVRNRKVHVHCAANFRASAFYSLYEVICGRWSVEQAERFIHDIWQPAEHSGWTEFIADVLGDTK